MTKFYMTDGSNRFLIDTSSHLQACKKAIENWEKNKKAVGKFIYLCSNGFDNIDKDSFVETSIVKGLDFDR